MKIKIIRLAILINIVIFSLYADNPVSLAERKEFIEEWSQQRLSSNVEKLITELEKELDIDEQEILEILKDEKSAVSLLRKFIFATEKMKLQEYSLFYLCYKVKSKEMHEDLLTLLKLEIYNPKLKIYAVDGLFLLDINIPNAIPILFSMTYKERSFAASISALYLLVKLCQQEECLKKLLIEFHSSRKHASYFYERIKELVSNTIKYTHKDKDHREIGALLIEIAKKESPSIQESVAEILPFFDAAEISIPYLLQMLLDNKISSTDSVYFKNILIIGNQAIPVLNYYLQIEEYKGIHHLIKIALEKIKQTKDAKQIKQIEYITKQTKRQVAFEMIDPETGLLVAALEIINISTENKVTFRDVYQIGQKVTFLIKFEKFQTQQISTNITLGAGPQVLSVPMKKLKSLEFAMPMQKIVVDNIKYPVSFDIDSANIENHLITIKQELGRFYYTLMVSPNSKNLQIYGGYHFINIVLSKFRPGITVAKFKNISIARLTEHLEIISNRDGQKASLKLLETLLRNFHEKKMLEQCYLEDRKQLVDFIKSWEFDSQTDQMRQQIIMNVIREME